MTFHKNTSTLDGLFGLQDKTVYQTNLKSAMFLGQSAAKAQIADGKGGKHVHLSSVRSKLAVWGKGYFAYCATKGGLLMLVRHHTRSIIFSRSYPCLFNR